MAQPRFLADFQAKMNRLGEIRGVLQNSIERRDQFTEQLKDQLRAVSNKMRQLSGLINQLQNKANELEQQVGLHTASIGDKERQIGEYNQQIANTTSERDRLNQEYNEHRDRTQTQINDQQTRINQMEAQLREVTEQLRVATEQKQAAENQAQALQADIQARGDQKDRVHAEQITQMRQENEQQLQQQEQQLMQRINDCERLIAGYENQLRDKDAEHQQTRQQLDEHQNQAQGQVADLQREITRLTQENQQLIQRIMDATEAINQANEDLANMAGSIEGAQSRQEIEALLNEITQELEVSIQNISRSIQAQPLAPQGQQMAAAPGQPYDVESNFNNLMSIHANNNQTGEFTAFMRTLRRNGALQNSINKLINPAERRVTEAVQQLKQILQENRLIIPAQRAGKHKRKTMKKNRNQKGGFTYRTSSKRRSISSKSSTRRNSKSSSKSSSKRTYR